MSLREFSDRLGGEWRAWDNTPESVHPAMRQSGSLGGHSGGWLVFESANRLTRHRLTPIPALWPTASDDELREWLERAARTFRFPGGRYWTVSECVLPERRTGARRGIRRVLRFTAGARSLERSSWPREWRSFDDAQLAELLASSFPRPAVANDGAFHRRASDVRDP